METGQWIVLKIKWYFSICTLVFDKMRMYGYILNYLLNGITVLASKGQLLYSWISSKVPNMAVWMWLPNHSYLVGWKRALKFVDCTQNPLSWVLQIQAWSLSKKLKPLKSTYSQCIDYSLCPTPTRAGPTLRWITFKTWELTSKGFYLNHVYYMWSIWWITQLRLNLDLAQIRKDSCFEWFGFRMTINQFMELVELELVRT